MIVLSARVTKYNQADMAKWRMVNGIVIHNLPEDMKAKWASNGYEGLFSTAPKYFGMNRMYRNKSSHVTFEFTDQQWVMFLLRWG